MSEEVVEKQMQRGETSSAVRQMLGKHLDPPTLVQDTALVYMCHLC